MAGSRSQGDETVLITSRERVIFPDAGRTKGELADYYAAVAPLMLPFVSGRPVRLVRCPQGRAKKCFFQKHHTGGFGPHVHTVSIREKSGKIDDYLYVDEAAGLLECVQMGTIEFHGWQALADDVELPDRLVFDLDPDEGIGFAEVTRAACDIRDRLAVEGLTSVAMLTGGKGVHVIAPLTRGHSWEAHKEFAKGFATALAEAEPERFTATMSKAKRQGRIFIDWLRNQRGNTSVVPYSARARTGAPVAVPLTWGELVKAKDARAFSIGDAAKLLERAKSEGLAGWGMAEQGLPQA